MAFAIGENGILQAVQVMVPIVKVWLAVDSNSVDFIRADKKIDDLAASASSEPLPAWQAKRKSD